MTKTMAVLLFSAFCGASSQLLYKISLSQTGPLTFKVATIVRLLGNFYFVGGIILLGFQFVSWMWVLSRLEMNIAILFVVAVVPVLILVASQVILKENIPLGRWIGAGVILIGLIIASRTW